MLERLTDVSSLSHMRVAGNALRSVAETHYAGNNPIVIGIVVGCMLAGIIGLSILAVPRDKSPKKPKK